MKIITKWIIAAIVANILLLPATFAPAQKAAVTPQGRPFLHDCCRESESRAPYCCEQCCWEQDNCNDCLGAPHRY